MRFLFLSICAVAALLNSSTLQGQTESGFPKCSDAGTPPYGTQCECNPPIYRGEYLNLERDYRLHLPDGVVAFGNCGSDPVEGVRITLSNPTSDDSRVGPPWDIVGIWAFKRPSGTTEELADRFARELKEESQRNHTTDVEILPTTKISLGSLTWVKVKASLAQPPYGKLFYELMFAKDPRKDIDYQIGMICSADLCEKERQLFKSVIQGFSYVPTEPTETPINPIDAGSNRQ